MISYAELPAYTNELGLSIEDKVMHDKSCQTIKEIIRTILVKHDIKSVKGLAVPAKYETVIHEIDENLISLVKFFLMCKTQLSKLGMQPGQEKIVLLIQLINMHLIHLERIYKEYHRTRSEFYYGMLSSLVFGGSEVNIGGYSEEMKLIIQHCKKMFKTEDFEDDDEQPDEEDNFRL